MQKGEYPNQIDIAEPHEQASAVENMKNARAFFVKEFNLKFDTDGLAQEPTEEQAHRLSEWREQVGTMPEMPTLKSFYEKTLLAASLWRQETEGKTNYLIGKGAGVEIALLGEITGRSKKQLQASYRPHGDFELYDVDYSVDKDGVSTGGVYSDSFLAVFGSQEYFPPTKTKGLVDIPTDLLSQTAERVKLGDITVLVPQLELIFLDKWNSRESTPRSEGYDDELLARTYTLDKTLLHDYLQRFVIEPAIKRTEKEQDGYIDDHFAAIQKFFGMTGRNIESLNRELEIFRGQDVSYGGLETKYWVPLLEGQLDEDGNIVDETLKNEIARRIEDDFQARKTSITLAHERLDAYFATLNQ